MKYYIIETRMVGTEKTVSVKEFENLQKATFAYNGLYWEYDSQYGSVTSRSTYHKIYRNKDKKETLDYRMLSENKYNNIKKYL